MKCHKCGIKTTKDNKCPECGYYLCDNCAGGWVNVENNTVCDDCASEMECELCGEFSHDVRHCPYCNSFYCPACHGQGKACINCSDRAERESEEGYDD